MMLPESRTTSVHCSHHRALAVIKPSQIFIGFLIIPNKSLNMSSLILCMLIGCAAGKATVRLPSLNTIEEFQFQYSYSCQPSPISYRGAALFLTDNGLAQNDPDVLYNGACGADDYFEGMLGGNNFALVADLGDVALENVTSSRAFNYLNVVGSENIFRRAVKVIKGHTYVVLSARAGVRALFTLTVGDYQKNGPMKIRYAVKEYSLIQTIQESPGFSWNEPNH